MEQCRGLSVDGQFEAALPFDQAQNIGRTALECALAAEQPYERSVFMLAALRESHRQLPDKVYPGKTGTKNTEENKWWTQVFMDQATAHDSYNERSDQKIAQTAAQRFGHTVYPFEQTIGQELPEETVESMFCLAWQDIITLRLGRLATDPVKAALFLSAEECKALYDQNRSFKKTDIRYVLDSSPKRAQLRLEEVAKNRQQVKKQFGVSPYFVASQANEICLRLNNPEQRIGDIISRAEEIRRRFKEPFVTTSFAARMAQKYSNSVARVAEVVEGVQMLRDVGIDVNVAMATRLARDERSLLDMCEFYEKYADHPDLRFARWPFNLPTSKGVLAKLIVESDNPQAELKQYFTHLQEFRRGWSMDDFILRMLVFHYRNHDDIRAQVRKHINRVEYVMRTNEEWKIDTDLAREYVFEASIFSNYRGVELAAKAMDYYENPKMRRRRARRNATWQEQAALPEGHFGLEPFVFEPETGLRQLRQFMRDSNLLQTRHRTELEQRVIAKVNEIIVHDFPKGSEDIADSFASKIVRAATSYVNRSRQELTEQHAPVLAQMGQLMCHDIRELQQDGFIARYFLRVLQHHDAKTILQIEAERFATYKDDQFLSPGAMREILYQEGCADLLALDERIEEYLSTCNAIAALVAKRGWRWISDATIRLRVLYEAEKNTPEQIVQNMEFVCERLEAISPALSRVAILSNISRWRGGDMLPLTHRVAEKIEQLRERYPKHPDLTLPRYLRPGNRDGMFLLYALRYKDPIKGVEQYRKRLAHFRNRDADIPDEIIKWATFTYAKNDTVEPIFKKWRASYDRLIQWNSTLDTPCSPRAIEYAAWFSRNENGDDGRGLAIWADKFYKLYSVSDDDESRYKTLAATAITPETLVVDKEQVATQRAEIMQHLQGLDLYEKAAIAIAFGVELPETGNVSYDEVMQRCNVEDEQELMPYVLRKILPKIAIK